MPYWIIEFRITFRSDFHVGAGITLEGGNRHGLRSDENGWPYMPDTQVRGLIRQGAQNLIRWQPRLEPLFGRNFGAPERKSENTWSFTSARHPYIGGITGIINADASGLLANQTHIKLADGIAENLFSYQKGGSSDRFPAWQGKIYALEPAAETDAAFMITSMRSEDRIGHRRSRGYGKVVWEPLVVKKYDASKAANPVADQRSLADWLNVLENYTKGAQ